MLGLGIPIGCPRTYLKNGKEVPFGDWTAHDCLVADDVEFGGRKGPETKRKLLDIWCGFKVAEDIIKQPEVCQQFLKEAFGDAEEMGAKWPNYTVGSSMSLPELQSPRQIGWSIDQVRANPSVAGFAKLYHELSLLLPINPLDEIRNRLENPPGKTEKYPVAEVRQNV